MGCETDCNGTRLFQERGMPRINPPHSKIQTMAEAVAAYDKLKPFLAFKVRASLSQSRHKRQLLAIQCGNPGEHNCFHTVEWKPVIDSEHRRLTFREFILYYGVDEKAITMNEFMTGVVQATQRKQING